MLIYAKMAQNGIFWPIFDSFSTKNHQNRITELADIQNTRPHFFVKKTLGIVSEILPLRIK